MRPKYPDDFAAFILTNGRPNNVLTYETLRKSGYSGRIFLLIDDLDPTLAGYWDRFREEEIVIFDKMASRLSFDTADNFDDMRAICYARNSTFAAAERLGIPYFIQLDDDYRDFQYRFDQDFRYLPKTLKNLDRVFSALLDFFFDSGADSIAIAQGGDFIGGEDSTWAQKIFLRRKCMNSFFCSVGRKFPFVGRINEDVNTYTNSGSRGRLFFTTNQVNLNQLRTQSNPGGMSGLYLDSGTYVKSFYSVIFQPSSVSISLLRDRLEPRIHHSVSWRHTVPMILREEIRKI